MPSEFETAWDGATNRVRKWWIIGAGKYGYAKRFEGTFNDALSEAAIHAAIHGTMTVSVFGTDEKWQRAVGEWAKVTLRPDSNLPVARRSPEKY